MKNVIILLYMRLIDKPITLDPLDFFRFYRDLSAFLKNFTSFLLDLILARIFSISSAGSENVEII